MVAPQVLLLSSVQDSHAAAVLRELQSFGAAALLLEWDTFGKTWLLHWDSSSLEFTVEVEESSFSLADVGTWWMRRDPLLPESKSADPVEQYAAIQAVSLLRSMLHWMPYSRPGIDPISAAMAAEEKPLQQMIAGQVGLPTPDTYTGNNPHSAFEWADARAVDLCIKPASGGRLQYPDGSTYAHYTERFDHRPLEEYASLAQCPATFQTFIPKAFEIRCTVVGPQTFSASIHTKSASLDAQTDWRHYDWENTEYYPYELPAEIESRLLQLMHRLGLQYGACDFVVTPNGEHVFLEVNPLGQYLWIEQLTDLPISRSIASFLLGLAVQ